MATAAVRPRTVDPKVAGSSPVVLARLCYGRSAFVADRPARTIRARIDYPRKQRRRRFPFLMAWDRPAFFFSRWKGALAMGFGGFSWKRAVGISKLRSKIARSTGIPTTSSGRRNKVRRLFSLNIGGGKKAAAVKEQKSNRPRQPAVEDERVVSGPARRTSPIAVLLALVAMVAGLGFWFVDGRRDIGGGCFALAAILWILRRR